MAAISGPSFAIEVAEKTPTALTVASNSTKLAEKIAASLSNENFRAYTSEDMIGVGIGGTVKNIIAIGAGISDGLNLGENAKIALINRGLKEMQRLGVALGADKETFLGLSGVGDLFLTCTSNLSRNRMFGLLSQMEQLLMIIKKKMTILLKVLTQHQPFASFQAEWISLCQFVKRFTKYYSKI